MYVMCHYVTICFITKTETIRKYPSLPILNRICTKEYAVPNSDLIIPCGTPVVISLLGFGRDERYFPHPERYWPERFLADDKHYDENAFLAFGKGPRKCIGKLFIFHFVSDKITYIHLFCNCIAQGLGKMITKVGLVQLVRSFDFEAIQKGEIEFHNFSPVLCPKGGVEIRVVKRNYNK